MRASSVQGTCDPSSCLQRHLLLLLLQTLNASSIGSSMPWLCSGRLTCRLHMQLVLGSKPLLLQLLLLILLRCLMLLLQQDCPLLALLLLHQQPLLLLHLCLIKGLPLLEHTLLLLQV